MTDTPDMNPIEGAEAIFALVSEITQASEEGDLGRLDTIVDEMDGIVARTGVEMPGLAEKIGVLKSQTARVKRHFANTDAALWAGDLERAQSLNMEGPGLEMGMFHGEAIDEEADEAETDDEIEAFDFSDFAAELGIDLADLGHFEPEEDVDDLFADVANGVDGAIDALIESGADLNAPSGPSRHTALLAALDAPGRCAEKIGKLIAAGADARVIHEQGGDNAISWAMGYHHPETITAESERALIDLLVSHGVDVNHTIPGQWTALQRGIVQAGAPQVAALLAHGADASVDMFEGFVPEKLAHATLVMQAAAKPDVLEVLLNHGADPTRADALGRKPLDFVRSEATAARDRVDPDDVWTIEHAEALEISLGILERRISA